MWTGDLVHERKLAGIRRFADMRGWSVFTIGEKKSRPDRLPGALNRIRPVGCIVESSSGHRDLPPRLFGSVPTVYLDCPEGLYGDRVSRSMHDDEATVRRAFSELCSTCPSAYGVIGHGEAYFWSRKRVRIFRDLVGRSGLPCRVFPSMRRRDPAERAKRLAAWVKKLPCKCALFAVNDIVAREVVQACRAVGRSVPEDMTLVGVDNCAEICETSVPKISSVQIDFERAGYRAALLVDRLRTHRGPYCETFGPLMTVRRESTRGFGRCGPQMLAAIDLIRRESCNGLKARDVVKLFKGSRRLVDMRFREVFGHSILDEIQSVRFEKVLFLLCQTSMALGAVAAQCGFGSEVTLREQFRRRMGLSLRAWREANAEA